MRVNIATLENQLRRVTVSFDAPEVTKVTDKEALELANQVRIPGGYTKLQAKVARVKTIAEYRQIILGRARETLIDRAAEEGLKDLGFDTIGRPELDGDAELKAFGQPFEVALLVEQMPTPEKLVLEGLNFPPAPTVEVSEEDVRKAIDEELDRQTRYENMKDDRAISKGDLALLRLEFTALDGSSLGVESETMSVMVGTTRPTPPFQAAVAEAIEGRKLGEQVSVDFTWPKDAEAGDEKYQPLVGKTFRISLKADFGRTRFRPELDAAFVKEVAGLDTVDQYLAVVRAKLEGARRTEAEEKHGEAIMDLLLEANPMPLPERLFNRYVEDRLEHAREDAQQRGTPMPDDETRKKVEVEVRRVILKDALTSTIMQLAKIEPNRDQINEKVHALMGVMDQKNPRFREMYMNALAYYTSRDLDRQVYAYVLGLNGGSADGAAPEAPKKSKAKKAKAEAAAPEAPAEAPAEPAEAPAPKKRAPRKPKAGE